jgi:GWxTD domain-containing protein
MTSKSLTPLLLLLAASALSAQKPDTKKEAQYKKELASGYNRWIDQDVAWIVTDGEKKAFNQLGTDEEREQFVEQFWLRRDPTPETAENEYKEEHYRRIAYANDHFASGIPGWRTDRGRMYIRFGPPDGIDAHPSGGTYQRPAAEGGGETSTYPFEIWRYRHLENVGEDVQVEFVDPSMSGEYRITSDPCEKDALTYVPNAGLTQAEQQGLSTKTARFQNTDGTHCGAPLGGRPASYDEFTRLAQVSNLERPPSIKYRDLEAVLVTSHLSFNLLPMQVHVDYLRVTDSSVMANVTVQFENRDLQFQSRDGLEKAAVNLLGHVYTLSHRYVATFDKSIEVTAPGGMLEQSARERSVWQAAIPLAPGKYKLEIAAKDMVSGNLNRFDLVLDAPRYEEGELAASSLILADSISKLPLKEVGGSQFAIGDMKVRPRVTAQFTTNEKLGIYFQIYNSAPSARITYEVSNKQTGQKTIEFTEDSHNEPSVEKLLPLRDFARGEYRLRILIDDGSHTIERTAAFSIIPPPSPVLE